MLRRHVKAVRQCLDGAASKAYEGLRALEAEKPEQEPEEVKRARSQERDRLHARVSAVRRLEEPLEEISHFADGREGVLLAERNSILLLGDWGTGKAHFLCDFALQALSDGVPAVVVLASSLRTDIGPLDAVADLTGLAASGAELVHLLASAAEVSGRRALVLIDAVNESDREAWRRRLPVLVRDVGRTKHLGLIVSCRTPFDSSVVSDSARNRMVQVIHPGFEDQEFDAQLEFFRYYGLPPLHVPLLTAEFSRPLFLRLMCEGLRNLNKRSQKNKLRDIASGQKSMTYVLEHFVKRVGAEVEAAHGLPTKACWLVMKGDSRNGRAGLAGVLASHRREWLSLDEALGEVRAFAAVSRAAASSIIAAMTAAGLLIEHSRYQEGGYVDVFMLPYQRFSDHLVARHLLDEHLDASSEGKLRRSFYSNQRLGAVFLPDRWGHEFAEPGVASALMIEFPERVKRLSAEGGAPAELLAYLPRERRLLSPFLGTFLNGLYWRPNSSFTAETERLVTRLLDRPETEVQSPIYEVVVGLASRADHPLGVEWLRDRLGAMTMPDRDVEWSEFLRSAESDSNVHRLLAWVEREDRAKVDVETVERTLRILALLLTTTDRRLRDRATKAMVLLGEAQPRTLFGLVPEFLTFNDPYVSERVLAAAYGVCMRRWATEAPTSAFANSVAVLGHQLLELLLRPGAPHTTWHSLTRGYSIGVLQILLRMRPRALSREDKELLVLAPGQAPALFRTPSRIRKADVEDPELAIHMDFGNYTIGRLVEDRRNYDFKHREYAGVRRQIADRMQQLGYSSGLFKEMDSAIDRQGGYRRDAYKVDRYGKKYSWLAFFEMYGLRAAMGKIEDHPIRDPRSSNSDIDPSFPEPIPEWDPPRRSIFDSSPVEIHEWILKGETPDYESLLHMNEVDGHRGDWVLLDAAIHEGVQDGRELRGWVASVFVPERSAQRMLADVEAGRDLSDNGIPDLGADYYTFHGEIPWSRAYGSNVRTKRGLPKRVSDRAFDYFDRRWKPGIPVEGTCRRWAWEGHHSELNQVGSLVFPAPPIAVALDLRVVGGSSDMVDQRGNVATIYRKAPGTGFGSHFLYIRRDLVEEYTSRCRLRLVQALVCERNLSYRITERHLPDSVRRLFQAHVHRFATVAGLER